MTSVFHECKIMLVAVSILVAACPVNAHDVWITTDGDPAGNLRAMVHHGHPGDRETPDPDKLIEFDVFVDGQVTRSLLPGIKSASQDGIPILKTEPIAIEKGVVLLAIRYDSGYWVKTAHGYRNTSKQQVPSAEDSLLSVKFAKALVSTKPTARHTYGIVIGHRLEIVPLSDPFLAQPGDILKVRVHFDGTPLSGVGVEAGDGVTPMEEKDIPRYQTDKEGIAAVKIAKEGPQLLVVDYILSSIHPDLANRELYNATLSFVLPSK
ncbi:MAG TPA: DUF4198 domain-containing protein [Nitrospiraceae bacterium]|nr:DUF4198 domain-containing protein [Nitrospiraceae bacterium]